ncbi:MAG: CubicO group peptidase (beta-lactamase class C family) [Cyclobacteriaceae bacterium]|jgi:CubicO group peptidase (beta-lactamase class C family)
MLLACSFIVVQAQTKSIKLDKFFTKKMKHSGRIGMQVGYVAYGELEWVGSYGIKEYKKPDRINDTTLFMVASISKPMTALAMMKLYDEGKVSLDEGINTYLPFKIVNPHVPDKKITVRMLLAHVSSIRDNWEKLEIGYTIDQGGDATMSLEDFLKSYLLENGEYYDAEKNFYKHTPTSLNRYTNVGYGLIGYLVERISGMPFDEYMRQEVFKPLHMGNTYWIFSKIAHDNIALPHNMPYKETDFKGTQVLTHFNYPNYPSGQLRTTVTDYAQFVKLMLNNGKIDGEEFLSEATIREFLRVQYPEADKWQAVSWSYNEFQNPLYYMLMPRYPSHTGLDPGMCSVVSFDPETGTGAIILTNSPTTTFRTEKIIYLDMVKKLMKEAKKTSGI